MRLYEGIITIYVMNLLESDYLFLRKIFNCLFLKTNPVANGQLQHQFLFY